MAASALATPFAALAEEVAVDEIVVTGERVSRSLKDTSSSVFVIGAADLARLSGADEINEILALTPNVTLGSGDSGPTIRGQDSTGVLSGVFAFLGGSRPRATVQIDGRPLNFNEYIYGLSSVWDVARVEVFRGPQTTTQGRNSVAGAIFVNTNEPTYAFEAAAQAIVADQSTEQFSAVVSGPLVKDQVALRLSFDTRDADTWVNKPNTTRAITGTDPTRDDFTVGRARLLIEPAALPGVRALITYTHSESVAPQADAVDPPFRDRTDNGILSAIFDTNSDTGVLDLDIDLGGGLAWRNVATYADIQIRRFAPRGFGDLTIDTQEASIESILRYQPDDGALSGLLGVYYLDADQRELSDLTAFLGFGDFSDAQQSLGIFGEATFKATDTLSLTAGARYQRDEQDRTGALGPFVVDYQRSFDAVLPKFGIAWDATPELRIGAVAARGFNPGGTTISFTSGLQDEFGAEYLWNYELYARAKSADGRFSVQANLFYTDYQDAQRTTTIVLPGGLLDTAFDNADDARSFGLELEASFTPSPRFNLRTGLGLLDTELRRFPISADPVEGNRFQRAPSSTGFVAAHWSPVERLSLDGQVRYTAGFFSDDLNTPAFRVGSSVIVDTQIAYDLGRVRVFAFARNLFNEFQLTTVFSPDLATASEPQRIGAGVKVKF